MSGGTLDTVVISRKAYEKLLDSHRKLTALEQAGVDNWEWYGEVMSALYDEEDED